jgi:hypothetical protein
MPIPCPSEGGAVRCPACDAVSSVGPQPQETTPFPSATLSESKRLAQLWAEFDAGRDSDFDLLRPPPGLGLFARMNVAPQDAIPWLREEWTATCSRIAVASTPALERRAFWIACALGGSYSRGSVHERRRALQETALELLSEQAPQKKDSTDAAACGTRRRYRDILRAGLSRAALFAGDVEAAEAWLVEVDPRPDVLGPDSEYRFSAATIACERGHYDDVLALVGRTMLELPIAPHCFEGIAIVRMRALEKSGDLPGADRVLASLRARLGTQFYMDRIRSHPLHWGNRTLQRHMSPGP